MRIVREGERERKEKQQRRKISEDNISWEGKRGWNPKHMGRNWPLTFYLLSQCHKRRWWWLVELYLLIDDGKMMCHFLIVMWSKVMSWNSRGQCLVRGKLRREAWWKHSVVSMENRSLSLDLLFYLFFVIFLQILSSPTILKYLIESKYAMSLFRFHDFIVAFSLPTLFSSTPSWLPCKSSVILHLFTQEGALLRRLFCSSRKFLSSPSSSSNSCLPHETLSFLRSWNLCSQNLAQNITQHAKILKLLVDQLQAFSKV